MEVKSPIDIKQIPFFNLLAWIISFVLKGVMLVLNTVVGAIEYIFTNSERTFEVQINGGWYTQGLTVAIWIFRIMSVFLISALVIHAVLGIPLYPLFGPDVLYPDAPTQYLVESVIFYILLFMVFIAITLFL